MISIFQHTPLWVWILFVFLIYRGIQALRPRQMKPARMLLLPVIFFVWAILSITTELEKLWLGYIGFIVGLLFGFMMGWALWRERGSATFDSATRTIRRPGSPWTLILILLGFSSKFVLHVLLAQSPLLHQDFSFNLTYGLVSGLVDGIFWGGMLVQFRVLQTTKIEVI